MDTLAWHLHHDRLCLAHLLMVLLEGSRLDTPREVITKCHGDFSHVRGAVKAVLVRLPRTPVTVPLGGAKVTPAVTEVFLRARRIAEAEGSLTGVQHVFLALLYCPTFYKILVNSGCDVELFKEELSLAYKNTPMPNTSGTTEQLTKDFDITQYGEDLTEKAAKGKLQPVIGRDEEIDRIAQILSRMMTKAPLLIGEPGVGKTAVIEGLAQRIVEGAVPKGLRGRRIISLDLLNLSAGTSMRGEFEKRMKEIITFLQRRKKDVILFVDEIHTLVGAGKTSGSSDATQILKVPLARGEIVLVGATTLEEYKLHIEKDAAFCRRFQNIVVEAPSKERALSILKKVKTNYEKFHSVDLSDEVLEGIVALSDQYVKQRSFPDKALDLLDEACSWKKVSHNKQIVVLKRKIEEAGKKKDETAAEELQKWKDELAALEELTANGRRLALSLHDVAHILHLWTGIPLGKMTEDEISRVLRLADILSSRVIGQQQAVKAVADALAIQRAGLSPKNKPLGTFMFLGSSGVGKTELAKAVAEEMFDSEKNLIRLDMVEYQEAHSISRLIGPPPGYMGNDEGGQLTEAVRQKPHSVVLFDEVENAHKNLWSVLLPMLDEGHLSDSKGNRVDFTNCLIILTSNIGQQHILEGYKEARALSASNEKAGTTETAAGGAAEDGNGGKEPAAAATGGFKGSGKSPRDILKRMRQSVMKEVLGYFKPQVIGRMSEIIIFEPLNTAALKGVLSLKLAGLTRSLAAKGVDFKVTDSAMTFILERASSYKYGGRRMGKYLEKYIKPRVAPLLISGKVKSGDRAVLARSNTNPNQLNLIICELDEAGNCRPGTKYGTKLVVQEVKTQEDGDDDEALE
ncbi:hypothetical protein EAH_00045490 [Eimeria acervulina]|uniref:Clp R domain-containing protein n=1 Tax=Eimeria acervulina TaxID=5801 RepID=U6GWA6_EIMAC|nr:hypothetical protein EAH_00045490 [Eimeria acervulina]CDI83892.1 hypothetical protein EAH_00045490 [Eimeria acervulina]